MISKDNVLCYEKVRFCYAMDENLSFGKISDNVGERIYLLTQALNAPYSLNQEDRASCREFYKQYRAWLMEKYFSQYSSLSDYPTLASLKRKKYSGIDSIKELYSGGNAEHFFFLLQTFADFSGEQLNGSSYEPLGAHKMRLSVITILSSIYRNRFDWSISQEKELIPKIQLRIEDEKLKNEDYLQLIEKRNNMIDFIKDYESKELIEYHSGEEREAHPPLEREYQWTLEELGKLCKPMAEKFNREYIWENQLPL